MIEILRVTFKGMSATVVLACALNLYEGGQSFLIVGGLLILAIALLVLLFRDPVFSDSSSVQKDYRSGVDGPTIFFHEDDFGQVEILPNDNLNQLLEESGHVAAFAQSHFDGTGYTDIYLRNSKYETELNQRHITSEEIEKVFSSLGLERIPNVFTGYGQSSRWLADGCVAFGKDYEAVYYQMKDGIVQSIWLTNHWCLDRQKLADCLYEIGRKWKLVLQDWNLTATVDLCDKQAIEDYLSYHDEAAE